MANQKVSITQADLDIIKNIPGVRYDLPLTDQTYPAFSGLVGRSGSKFRKAGIYIFTHKATGSKYVGSSNSLSRRLEQYFSSSAKRSYHLFSQINHGLLIPLIQKEGLASFTLDVFVMPAEYSLDYYFLFLVAEPSNIIYYIKVSTLILKELLTLELTKVQKFICMIGKEKRFIILVNLLDKYVMI